MQYLLLVAGLAVFLGVHSVSIVAPGWRDAVAARLGEYPWKALYGLVALAGLVLLVKGFALARTDPVVLYAPPLPFRHVAALMMLPVFPLLLSAWLPGRVKATARHPMLTATKLWAAAHLLANGMLADVLLFGGFLAWAVADRISLKRRSPRPAPGLPEGRYNDLVVVVGGFALYVWFVAWAHFRLFGVYPLRG